MNPTDSSTDLKFVQPIGPSAEVSAEVLTTLAEIGEDLVHFGVRVPEQLVADVVAAPVQSPVVAALGVEAGRAGLHIAVNPRANLGDVGAFAAGQFVEVSKPDGEVLVEAHGPGFLPPDVG